MKSVKIGAVFAALFVGAALLVGQAAADTTQIKITNNGAGDLTVSSSIISPPAVLGTGDQIETNVSTSISATATVGDAALNFHVRNFGPNYIRVTKNGLSTVLISPYLGLGINADANDVYVIDQNP